jgi:hypothetical protein
MGDELGVGEGFDLCLRVPAEAVPHAEQRQLGEWPLYLLPGTECGEHTFGVSVDDCDAWENPAVQDVELLNPYLGIDASQNELHNIRNVTGQPLRRGIWVDAIYDIGRIENVHFNPWWRLNALMQMQNTFAGIEPYCDVCNPITQTIRLLTPETTRPVHIFLLIKIVATAVREQDR